MNRHLLTFLLKAIHLALKKSFREKLTYAHACTYQGVRKSFSEHFAYTLNGWSSLGTLCPQTGVLFYLNKSVSSFAS